MYHIVTTRWVVGQAALHMETLTEEQVKGQMVMVMVMGGFLDRLPYIWKL